MGKGRRRGSSMRVLSTPDVTCFRYSSEVESTIPTTTIKMSSHHHAHNRSSYVSPLQRLDATTRKYSPKKFLENNQYKQLYLKGECGLFQKKPSIYQFYFIHSETSTNTLNDLIEYAKETTTYTIDTEDQMHFRQPSKCALLQIEFMPLNERSIVILIEALHLPPVGSSSFKKIRSLCKTIFSSGHRIVSWGEIAKEMGKFVSYGLFDVDDISRAESIDLQQQYTTWFNRSFPTSVNRKTHSNDVFSLQTAVYLTFNEWIDKRMTLADWGCCLDTESRIFRNQSHRDVEHEKEIRRMMTLYAIHDCFAVTRLANHMASEDRSTPPPTITYEQISDDEQTAEGNDEELTIYLSPPIDEDEPGVHVRDEPMVSNESEIVVDVQREVHVRDELQHNSAEVPEDDVEPLMNRTDERRTTPVKTPLTRNQKKNRKKRANRYRHEVIRHVHDRFSISNIKTILIDMNIHYANMNVVGHTLFIGLRDEETRKHVDDLLHGGMFTKEHYCRIQKRSRRY